MCGRSAPLAALSVFLFAGCAGHFAHREGMDLLAQGKYEDAVAKLQDASIQAPDEQIYRLDYLRSRDQAVNRLIVLAYAERTAGHSEMAAAIFRRALKIDAQNERARSGLEMIAMDRRHAKAILDAQAAIKKDELEEAKAVTKNILLENPAQTEALQIQQQIVELQARDQLAGPQLKPKFQKPVTLQFRDANLKMIVEAISRTSGINILLDKDVKGEVKTSLFVKEVSVEDTIDLILLQNQLEKKVLSDNTILIYPNTPAKTKEYQDLKVRSFHLVNADAKQMQTMIKTMLKTKDLFIHEKTNSLIMRDTPEAIRLAEKMIADQDMADPEVMLEVEVLEVTRSRLSSLGITYPDTFSLATPGAPGSMTLGQLRDLGSNSLIASPLSATLNLKLQDSDANVLASPRILVKNREKAKILIGDRVPVISQSVQTGAAGTTATSSNVNYLDVGLKLDVEPNIQPGNEIAIKLNLEVSSINREIQVGSATAGYTLAYQLGTRNVSTVLRLKNGETQVLAGLISDEDRRSASKIPGLGQLPILGRLFSSNGGDAKKTEIILSITPHLVGKMSVPDAQTTEYWTGTESSLRSKPLTLRHTGTMIMAEGKGAASLPAQSKPVMPQPGARRPAAPAPAAETPEAAERPAGIAWQGPVSAKAGERIALTLNAQTSQKLADFSMIVGFDPAVLKGIEVSEGTLWKQSKAPGKFSQAIDASSGQIAIEFAQGGGEGAGGTGSIATMVFEVLVSGVRTQLSVAKIAASSTNAESISFSEPGAHTLVVAQP